MARREIRVPDLGDFKSVEIVELVVKPGDQVRAEQTLIVLETDKAAMEVPSPVAGTLLELKVAQGDRVSTGDLIAFLEADETAAEAPAEKAAAPAAVQTEAPAVPPPARPAPERPASAPVLPPIDEPGFARAHASPSVRKFARELGVDLGQVKGSGQKGRALLDDVKLFVKSVLSGAISTGPTLAKVPVVDFAKFGPVEVRPLSRVRKISGPRLQAAWLNIPHVTQQDEADITALEELRKALKKKATAAGVKLTPLAFFIRAAVLALKEFPDCNSSLTEDGSGLVHKKYWHIGFAADTPQGLVVPVIRDADQKDLFTIARELGTQSEKARNGKLAANEMQGATFTISSLGGIGGTHFSPIINAPEVAILGVGRASVKPVWANDRVVPRLLLPLSLAYDHRVIDGATGARFSTFLVGLLGDVGRLLVD
ncbi:MAG: 2-oxo acid dehydrogenase subunit E2 [Gammaproteobacteria bacterium]|jgi:pyruvate dehydrogenase E2 component (dihydrolipoamide acetyltransferase)|nr:2-oxo acid dehydrogenase subunit E2 [Gammaproteobacteria bacterium]MBK6585257.1 2-oxo acid dehydrogenase subunit E2 [Gammaproteobacteria bacterium]MBK7169132.1 2-oxo acid dehydrogenase subunit E2 [Gammaproteobacteria bacterium]MBK7520020.1 2-oxo acid dehydrogenase subunit E2 [Gammaproteobacteria bacterium]MBK7730718.1 2-oxo acid dehydrogenase subunit E2 [Gammaproteobacteria bacterium]